MNILNQANQITGNCISALENILKNENDSAIILHPSSNKIFLANLSACKVLGYTKNEITQFNLNTILSKSFTPIKIQESKADETSIELCQFITKSGFSFIAESKKQAIKIDNQTCQLICFSDLSEIVSDSSIKNESEGLIPFYKKILDINQEVLCVNHDMFFKNMVYSLSNKLNVRWVMICKLIQSHGSKKSQILS